MTHPEHWTTEMIAFAENCEHKSTDLIVDDTWEGPHEDPFGYRIVPPATCNECGLYFAPSELDWGDFWTGQVDHESPVCSVTQDGEH